MAKIFCVIRYINFSLIQGGIYVFKRDREMFVMFLQIVGDNYSICVSNEYLLSWW